MKAFLTKVMMSLLLYAALMGCSTFVPEVTENTDQQVRNKLEGKRERHGNHSWKNQPVSTTTSGTLFLGEPFSVNENINLPANLTRSGFEFSQKTEVPFQTYINRLSNEQGLSIYVRSDALAELGDREVKDANKKSKQGDSAGETIDKSVSQIGVGSKFKIIGFKGNVASLLDLLTARVGLFWEWSNGRIEVFRNKRKTFIVNTDAQAVNFVSSIASQGRGSSEGSGMAGSSRQSITSASTYDTWSEILEQIQQTVSAKGRVVANKSVGTVTVIDTPPVIEKTKYLIDNYNRSLEKRLVLDLHILQVAEDVDSKYGIDWAGILEGGNISANLNTNFNGGEGFLGIALNDPDERLDGSSWLIDALSSQVKTTGARHLSAVTQNGVAYPFQDIVEEHFIKNTKTTIANDVASTEAEQEVITEGITVFIRPQVTDTGKILVRFSYTFGDILSLQERQIGENQTIVSPRRRLQSNSTNIIAESGQPILLTGFRQNSSAIDKRGTGHHDLWALGGSRGDNNSASDLVILAKVTLLD